jgi:hypothetical protein
LFGQKEGDITFLTEQVRTQKKEDGPKEWHTERAYHPIAKFVMTADQGINSEARAVISAIGVSAEPTGKRDFDDLHIRTGGTPRFSHTRRRFSIQPHEWGVELV